MLRSLPQGIIDKPTTAQLVALQFTEPVEGHPGVYTGAGFHNFFSHVFEDDLWFDPPADSDMKHIVETLEANVAEDRMAYGVADSLEQILDRLQWLTTDEQAYVLVATLVSREATPDFRWHKHGRYIGDFTDLAEHLGDSDSAIESVVTFTVHQFREEVLDGD